MTLALVDLLLLGGGIVVAVLVASVAAKYAGHRRIERHRKLLEDARGGYIEFGGPRL